MANKKSIEFRCGDDDRLTYESSAKQAGLSLSAWIKSKLDCNQPVRTNELANIEPVRTNELAILRCGSGLASNKSDSRNKHVKCFLKG